MSNRLSGKICIITRSGGSMGREAALTFAREGAFGRWLRSVRRRCGSDGSGGWHSRWNNGLHAAIRLLG